MIRLIGALLLLISTSNAWSATTPARDLELIEEFTLENYAYGDDGIDCETEISSPQVVKQSGTAIDTFKHRLYSYTAIQANRPHGCGMRLSCFALLKEERKSGRIELAWASCDP